MKPSRYNVYSKPIGGCVFVYNTLTQNAVDLELSEYSDLLAGVDSGRQLEKLGLLIDDSLDEVAEAVELRRAIRARPSKALSITVIPSFGCNYSCGYCYNGVGHPNTNDKAISFHAALTYATSRLKEGQELYVTWYGGEPTLHLKLLKEWTDKFQALCRAKHSNFSADLLTNGSALTASAGDLIRSLSVSHVQISIDWPLHLSQRRIPGKTASESLLRVLENCNNIPDEVDVTIRVNTFPGFIRTFSELLSLLRSNVRRPIDVYAHRLYESNVDALNNVASGTFRYSDGRSYSQDYLKAKRMLREFGYAQEYFPLEFVRGVCIAQAAEDVLFTPTGEGRKCVREVFGPGASSNRADDALASFYRSYEAYESEPCRCCTYLPICHGGCVKEANEHPVDIETRCTLWKHILVDELTSYLVDKEATNA